MQRMFQMAGAERFELSRTVLETAMLTLHHAPLAQRTYYSIQHRCLSIISMLQVLYWCNVLKRNLQRRHAIKTPGAEDGEIKRRQQEGESMILSFVADCTH